jgi:hypothetical protein
VRGAGGEVLPLGAAGIIQTDRRGNRAPVVCLWGRVSCKIAEELNPLRTIFTASSMNLGRVVRVQNRFPIRFMMQEGDGSMAQSTPPVFLLNPANLAFLKKEIKRPVLPEQKPFALVITFIVAVGSLIGFLVLATPYWKNWYDLKNSGVETTGQMIDLKNVSTKKNPDFKVTYQFVVNGQTYQASQTLHSRFYYSAYDYQNNLPIRYVSGNPEVSRLSGGFEDANENFYIILSIVGAIWVFCWLIGLIASYNAYDQNSHLLSHGKLVKGAVTACDWYKVKQPSTYMGAAGAASGGAIGGAVGAVADHYMNKRLGKTKYKIKLSYKFTSPKSGREIRKTEKVLLPEMSRQGLPPSGMPVAVLYRTDKHFRVL